MQQPRRKHKATAADKRRTEQRSHKMRAAGEMWNDLRQALDHLSALPHPRDVAEHICDLGSVRKILDQRLPIAARWLMEFEHEWNDARRRAALKDSAVAYATAKRLRTDGAGHDDDAGHGAQDAETKLLEP